MPDFSNIRYFVAFIGSARSGTTLVRSLLDAHPNAVIGNEVNVLRHLKNGKSWHWVLNRIVENSNSFLADPIHTGYDYGLPIADPHRNERIEIIGDKKAGVSTVYFQEEPALLEQFLEWVEVPVKFIHCVRNPLDVIATKMRRLEERDESKPLAEVASAHFELHKTSTTLFNRFDSNQCMRIYHEDVVTTAPAALTDLLKFLELIPDSQLLKAFETIVNPVPHRSRHLIEWPPNAIASVEREIQKCHHLHRYLDGGRLIFDPNAAV